jgi:ribosomal protein L37AE/L43A
MMVTEFWEAKYKACRSAFLKTSEDNRKAKKMFAKDRNRIIQLCYEGIRIGEADPSIYRRFEKILGILGVSGYGGRVSFGEWLSNFVKKQRPCPPKYLETLDNNLHECLATDDKPEKVEIQPDNSYLNFERKPVEPVVINGRDIQQCISCGIQDARVEAGGIWHCPNPLCTVSGAYHARQEFGFHASEDSEGITPTNEFVALRGWAKRMFEKKK